MRWPAHLQESIPQIRQFPWWVEQNHLSTQIKKEGNPISPKKIDFGIEIFLKAGQSFQVTDYKFETQEMAKIIFAPHLAGKGDHLSLLMEGQKLLTLQNIRVKPSNWYGGMLPDNWLQEVGVKDGHLFLRAAIGALNLFRNTNNPSYSDIDLQPFVLPQLPIAYDEKSGKVYRCEEYQSAKAGDEASTRKIQATFEICENGQLPTLVKLSDILSLIQDFGKMAEAKKKAGLPEEGPSALSQAVSSLVFKLDTLPDEIKYPNFYAKFHSNPQAPLHLEVETKGLDQLEHIDAHGSLDLDELFIPGALHLDSTQLDFNLSYWAGREMGLHLDGIHARLKPFAYLGDNPRKLGWLQIREGEVWDGEPLEYQGIHFLPGIHLQQISPDTLQLQVNLNLHAKVSAPWIGEVEIDTPFLFQTEIKADPLSLLSAQASASGDSPSASIIPQSTIFYLPGLHLRGGAEAAPRYETNLILTDIPALIQPAQATTMQSGFWASFILQDAEKSEVKDGFVEGFFPLALNDKGQYDLASLQSYASADASLNFSLAKSGKIAGDLHFSTLTDGNTREMLLQASAERFDGSKKGPTPILKDFQIRSARSEEGGVTQQDIAFDASALYWGPIGLTFPHIKLSYSEVRREDGSLARTVQSLEASANKKTSPYRPSGLVRGPITLRNLSSKKSPLQIILDPQGQQAQIKNLALGFNVQRITLPAVSRATHRAISGIDLDGRILGHWDFNTETYAGKGRILIRGDQEGDIHFRGTDGRRLEAALNPEDPNRLYELPLLADTRFVIDRLRPFDAEKEQLQGHFHLSTLVDWLALKALGIEWNEHDEFEFDFDHLPYSEKGYAAKIRQFFTYIAQHPAPLPAPEAKP